MDNNKIVGSRVRKKNERKWKRIDVSREGIFIVFSCRLFGEIRVFRRTEV